MKNEIVDLLKHNVDITEKDFECLIKNQINLIKEIKNKAIKNLTYPQETLGEPKASYYFEK